MSTTTVSTPLPSTAPAWAAAMRRVTNYLVHESPEGRKARQETAERPPCHSS